MPRTDPLIPRDMARAILRCDAEATKILHAFIKTVESKKPPPMLYHYTNDAGLAGIIESERLWFSDIFALNDPSELRHGLSIAIDLLKSRASTARPEVATFASMFERFDLDAGIEAAGHFFICCFSGDGDDLGQRRAYADNGQGFALGFDTAQLENAFTKKKGKPIKQHSTFHVTYDDAELTRIETALTDLIDPLISLPRTTGVRGDTHQGTTSFVLQKLDTARAIAANKHSLTKEQLKGVTKYLGAAPDDINIASAFEDYRTRAAAFHAWFNKSLRAHAFTNVNDYERCMLEHRRFATRTWWNCLLGNWLNNWKAPPNPYNHLDKYLTPAQMDEVMLLPKGSTQQVDKIIAFVDVNGACTEQLRQQAYELFRRAPAD